MTLPGFPYTKDFRSSASAPPKGGTTNSVSASAPPKGGTTNSATRVNTVYATKLQDSEKVFIGADGMITNYKSFTIESPASIVFDIFDVKSPYEKEKVIAVNTGWVKKVRYYGYPDRLRVILDTESKYLSSYSAYPVDNGLLINVGKPGSSSAGFGIQGSGASPVDSSLRLEPTAITTQSIASVQSRNLSYLPPTPADAPARKLQAIYATQFKNGIIVTVRGDGSIKYYESSTIENPPSIIFDIFNLSAHEESGKEISKIFPVDTQWVKSIRHEQHPDRLRLFIETRQPYLSAYRANPDENGLLIYVGESSSGITVAKTSEVPKISEVSSAKQDLRSFEDSTQPVWVDHLDFVSREAGKSELVIKTTSPVKYSINEISDPATGAKTGKNLELKIINTQLPKHRQGALIKEKSFESAVEQITSETLSGNSSLFSVRSAGSCSLLC